MIDKDQQQSTKNPERISGFLFRQRKQLIQLSLSAFTAAAGFDSYGPRDRRDHVSEPSDPVFAVAEDREFPADQLPTAWQIVSAVFFVEIRFRVIADRHVELRAQSSSVPIAPVVANARVVTIEYR